MSDKSLSGYAAVFFDGSADSQYELPGITERINANAFTRTLVENTDVFGLISHDHGRPIARTISEPPSLYLQTDKHGLSTTILPVDSVDGRDVISLVESRVLSAMSFGFCAVKDEWTPGPGGTAIRELQDVELLEVSAVCWPAYRGTQLSVSRTVRSLTHTLGEYANRAKLIGYTPKTVSRERTKMLVERADEKRDSGQLLLQSKLRLYKRRANLVAEMQNTSPSQLRQAELMAELADLERQERNMEQIAKVRGVA